MPSEETGRYVSVGEAARIIGVSLETLDRWARHGRIPSEVTDDGTRVFLMTDLVKIAVREGDRPPPPCR